jgi:hypothetical protein
MKKVINCLLWISLVVILCLSSGGLSALASFDSEEIFENQEIYGSSKTFSSASKIQEYLSSKGSLLASFEDTISLESDDTLLKIAGTAEHIKPYLGKKMSAAEIIWQISQGSLGNGCSTQSREVCVDNSKQTLNPAFLLAKIQKESGLVYGPASKRSATSSESVFLLQRATGYYCTEKDKKDSCFDENPDWKYYSGFFRQVYFAARFIRILDRRCQMGGSLTYIKGYEVGKTIQVEGKDTILKNGITCALYIYTPNFHAQRLLYCIWLNLERSADCQKEEVENKINPNPVSGNKSAETSTPKVEEITAVPQPSPMKAVSLENIDRPKKEEPVKQPEPPKVEEVKKEEPKVEEKKPEKPQFKYKVEGQTFIQLSSSIDGFNSEINQNSLRIAIEKSRQLKLD